MDSCLDDLSNSVKTLAETVMDKRREFGVLVHELYSQDPPFKYGLERSRESYNYEIKKFIEVVSYTLLSGDESVLDNYCITPIMDDFHILSAHDKPHLYINAVNELYEEAVDASEKLYFEKLLNTLKQFTNTLKTTSNLY